MHFYGDMPSMATGKCRTDRTYRELWHYIH